MEKKGLFQLIRETSFTKFFIIWIITIFAFGILYWIISLANPLIINGSSVQFSLLGIFNAFYGSLLIATVFGLEFITHLGIVSVILYIQVILSVMLLLILADKIIIKYIHPNYHAIHHQDKKINTMMIMMSVFRTDADRLMHEYITKKKHINIKEIEATIDGLYVVFLDIERLFSPKNINITNIKKIQYFMITENIEDSLHKLELLIDFLIKHKITWKDKSTEFWLNYILETAEKISDNIDYSSLKNPKIIIAVENIRDYTEKIKKKI